MTAPAFPLKSLSGEALSCPPTFFKECVQRRHALVDVHNITITQQRFIEQPIIVVRWVKKQLGKYTCPLVTSKIIFQFLPVDQWFLFFQTRGLSEAALCPLT